MLILISVDIWVPQKIQILIVDRRQIMWHPNSSFLSTPIQLYAIKQFNWSDNYCLPLSMYNCVDHDITNYKFSVFAVGEKPWNIMNSFNL